MQAKPVNPDDKPNLDKVLPPMPHLQPVSLGEWQVLFPPTVFDELAIVPPVRPKSVEKPIPVAAVLELPSEPSVIEDIEFDLELVKFIEVNEEEPVVKLEEEQFMPYEDNEWSTLPYRPGQENECGLELPQLPEMVPGEPKLNNEQVVSKEDDEIALESVEMIQVEPVSDQKPNLPGTDAPPELPFHYQFDIAKPKLIDFSSD